MNRLQFALCWAILMLSLALPVYGAPNEQAANDARVARIEGSYNYLVLTAVNWLAPGVRVMVATKSGVEKEFRIEKVGSWGASAIPKTDLLDIEVGAAVRLSTFDAAAYLQDRPLATAAEARRAAEESAELLRRRSDERFRQFVGTLEAGTTAVARGANSTVVGLRGQAHLNEQQRRYDEGLPVEEVSTADLAQRLAGDGALTPSIGSSGVGPATTTASGVESLSAICEKRIAPQRQACQGSPPTQAPCYRAAASLCQCYLDNGPQVNPSRPEWTRCVRENTQRADALISGATTVRP